MGRDPQDPDELTGTLKNARQFFYFSSFQPFFFCHSHTLLSYCCIFRQAGYLKALACLPANQPIRLTRVPTVIFLDFLGVWHVKPKHAEGGGGELTASAHGPGSFTQRPLPQYLNLRRAQVPV